MYTEELAAAAGPPKSDNILINGKMLSVAGTAGAYDVQTLTPSSTHLLRIVNTAIDAGFYVSLDSHEFTVVQADFVPIVPYTTNWLFVAIGQRYNVVINANQTAGNYWFRAVLASGCGSSSQTAAKSIFTYDGVTLANPTSTATTQPLTACLDELSTNLVPHNSKGVDSTQFDFTTLGAHTVANGRTSTNVVFWAIDDVPINIDWDIPTLSYG
jgi:FtsP/CotA-like multicopper oxidase with cupredoxin domain